MMAGTVLWEKTFFGVFFLQIVQGDITAEESDAVVNAANSELMHGGGVAGAIVRRGGQVIQDESARLAPVEVGGAVVTTAGRLPCRAVIHAVGPRMGEGDEDRKLESAVRSALTLASERGFRSLSMPAISSGIFGFPKDRCAYVLLRTTTDYLHEHRNSPLRLIRFCNFDEATCSILLERFRANKDELS